MNIYRTMYHPRKPEGIENRRAYVVGGGIAGLATAAFLVDDAGMPGENITIYEQHSDVGGCCDGTRNEMGYLCRGERELEPYMECLWYLYSKIPSLENEGRRSWWHSPIRYRPMISCIWDVTAAYRSRSLFCIPKPRSASNLQIKPLCESDRIGAVSVSL